VAAEIRRTWAEFFDGTTSLHRRVQLLQDGRRFAAVLRAEARSPLASQASVTVSSVQLTGSTAVVHYALTVAGQPVPITQVGEAVHAGGSWKLSGATFCSLLAMTGAKLPAACPKAVQPSSSAVTFPPPAHG
jgi:hypothetical protein